MNKLGVEIILHCFYKNISDTSHLKTICSEVHLYPRQKTNLLNSLPFIVSSRSSNKLVDALENDNHPILIEGIHSTAFLTKLKNKNRNIALRTHNIEHDYYLGLARLTSNPFLKLYYNTEARRLKKYEKRLDKELSSIFSLSQKDSLYYKTRYKKAETFYTCAFYDDSPIVIKPKNYVILQGNFLVDENKQAAKYILEKVAPLIPNQKFVIAGKNADFFSSHSELDKNIIIASSLEKDQMARLNNEAKASIVYSHLNAGVKLKILNSLSAGVPTFCNKELQLDPYLKNCISTYSSPNELVKLINRVSWELKDREKTQASFKSVFNLNHFARQITDILEV